MKSSAAPPIEAPHSLRWLAVSAAGFGLTELRGASPLTVALLPSGALFAIRHGGTLINQLLPGPAAEGLLRLLVRWRDDTGVSGWARLVGPGLEFGVVGREGAVWQSTTGPGLCCVTVLRLNPEAPAWTWRVQVHNRGPRSCTIDVVQAQDLGLADEGAVRNNEAYTSQYLDLQPAQDPDAGWVILARQNLAMTGGRHPWLAVGSPTGAEAYCTDAAQFFGRDHRLTGEPAAVRLPALPSRRLQYECALAGLQSRALRLAPGADGEIVFAASFQPDHPAASSSADLAAWRAAWPKPGVPLAAPPTLDPPVAPSLLVAAPWLHGDTPEDSDWAAWFPGERRHEERDPAGRLQAFFHGAGAHVVARGKEAEIARPHGHILRSGDSRWIDMDQFGVTCYAAGIFGAQAYLGNPGLVRLLSVVRNGLNLARGAGQRVFVRHDGAWCQLGVPSAFVVAPGEVRWIYRFGGGGVEVRVWCSRHLPASFLALRVVAGPPLEFLVTHELALDPREFDEGGEAEVAADGAWVGLRPGADSLLARHLPGVGFAIAAADPGSAAEVGGDEMLYPDGRRRGGPYIVLRTAPVSDCGVALLGQAGGSTGAGVLARAVAAARTEFAAAVPPAVPPPAPVRLRHPGEPAVARIDEILPWFTHNASIHFSAPHGLEQYGGGAWGVRDVCQGSIEWLLAAGEFGTARRVLETVFGQQYRHDGSWPQWFMPPPFRFIQQAHSHGDICFWPVKALADYVEASNDLAFLDAAVGYTDPHRFEPVEPHEPLWEHCARVAARCRARFLPGTALVDYGDGDWDDTLQPADAELGRRMASAWTVALACQTFRQLARVARRAGVPDRAEDFEALSAAMERDFSGRLMPGGVVAGFLVLEPGGIARPLLHPDDPATGIRYRLLPMTRAILAGLFTPEQARRHLELIRAELSYPDGVRLMSAPADYQGGRERLFRRAETAANVGREIGLQYVHAHLRYAEALARVGDADGLWHALQVVNPVGLAEVVPHAAARQSNVYFSSSDADFADRGEAAAHWADLRTGRVAVRGGWRLYSSGPGLFLHLVRASLLGVRESFDDVVFDPVLPRRLDGLVAAATVAGHPVTLRYRVQKSVFSPRGLTVNGVSWDPARREANPYRAGGVVVPQANLRALLRSSDNVIAIDL